MEPRQWYILGGFLFAAGLALLVVTQVILNRWRKRLDRGKKK